MKIAEHLENAKHLEFLTKHFFKLCYKIVHLLSNYSENLREKKTQEFKICCHQNYVNYSKIYFFTLGWILFPKVCQIMQIVWKMQDS